VCSFADKIDIEKQKQKERVSGEQLISVSHFDKQGILTSLVKNNGPFYSALHLLAIML
jgi:hypothetical protein